MSGPVKDTKTKNESKSTLDNSNLDNKYENFEYSKKRRLHSIHQIVMGTSRKVTPTFNLMTYQAVSIKILDKWKINDEINFERIISEIEILKNIHHPDMAQNMI